MIFIYLLLSFLFGGIPVGYIIVKLKIKEDIRTMGSKNIGATNVGRVLGKKWFFIVLLIDAIKGITPLIIAKYLLNFGNMYLVVIGFIVILGNIFSPYLKFKGGKGIGTSVGVLSFLMPIPFLISLGIFIVVLVLSNYLSLGSVVSVFIFPFLVYFFQKDIYMLIFSILLALIIIYRHKSNIKRLIKGEENKFIKK